VLYLDDRAVRQALDPRALVGAMETVFRDLGTGRAASTIRVRAATEGAMASAMAAAVPSLGVSGGKVYATVDGQFTFHVVLFDLDGNLLCALDGAALTEARTPALCAVAIKHFGPSDIRVAAVLGTGREAIPHLEMLHAELPGVELRLWGRRSEAATDVAAACGRKGIAVSTRSTAEAAVAAADIVVTVTSANAPIVDPAAISERALVCAVGATKPQRCEIDSALFARSAAVITDSTVGAPNECGDLIHAVDAGVINWADVIDLSDVLAGKLKVERAGVRGPIIFETQGVAAQDVAAAAMVWRRSTQLTNTTTGGQHD
jgi:ornithine cyclodeaminase